jgi:membrane protein implicated in regulation of membrane protease activity
MKDDKIELAVRSVLVVLAISLLWYFFRPTHRPKDRDQQAGAGAEAQRQQVILQVLQQ